MGYPFRVFLSLKLYGFELLQNVRDLISVRPFGRAGILRGVA